MCTIDFAIPGPGVHTIGVRSELPTVAGPTLIDGYSQPGATPNSLKIGDNAKLEIEIVASTEENDLLVLVGAGCEVRGLSIHHFLNAGVYAVGDAEIIDGNFIGIELDGLTTDGGNYGVDVAGGEGNRVGGTFPAGRNVIAGNSAQVALQADSGRSPVGTVIQGNYLGLTADGSGPASHSTAFSNVGVGITDGNATIVGGGADGAGNVIAGVSTDIGIYGLNGHTPEGTVVRGNLLGTDATGTVAIPQTVGIQVISSSGNLIGGTGTTDGNVIAGCTFYGISITATSDAPPAGGNRVEGNFIGTDRTGTRDLGNQSGIVDQAAGNIYGGLEPGAGNVIAYWSLAGIGLGGPSQRDTILSNSYRHGQGDAISISRTALGQGTNAGIQPPILRETPTSGSAMTVSALLLEQPNTRYAVQFYEGTGQNAGGISPIELQYVTTDAIGRATVSIPETIAPGQTAAATVTDPVGDTSRFSYGFQAMPHLVPGDFGGTVMTDLTVFRPSEARWLSVLPFSILDTTFGEPNLGDIPVPGDYDGVGRAELAVFRPSTGQWLIQRPDGSGHVVSFGAPDLADIPAPADYDGDGKTDLAVFRPSTGQWLIQLSSGGARVASFGAPNLADIPVPADYDGDGRADLAVFRPITGQWLAMLSGGGVMVKSFGAINLADIPVPGDYDGDGKAELAIYRPAESRFLSVESGGGVLNRQFGAPNLFDIPTQAPIAALVKLGRVGGVHASSVRVLSMAATTDIAMTPEDVEVPRPNSKSRRAMIAR